MRLKKFLRSKLFKEIPLIQFLTKERYCLNSNTRNYTIHNGFRFLINMFYAF